MARIDYLNDNIMIMITYYKAQIYNCRCK